MKKARAFIDGSGNSGRVQACACVMYVEGEVGAVKRSRLLLPNTTNNVGEYNGLLLALALAAELGVQHLEILSDSKLIVHQVRGEWKCNNLELRPLRDHARDIAQTFFSVSIEWIPREQNKEADSLCREAIKSSQSSPTNPFLQPR